MERHLTRVTLAIVTVVSVAASTVLRAIEPRSKPLIVVYTHSDCRSCLRWMDHLAARGFRTQLGREADWPVLRQQLAVSPALHSSLTAVVDGLLIEGPVPPRDIHRALTLRSSYDVRALIVPGMPRGLPWSDSPLPQRYTVFVVRDDGRVQEFAVYE